MLSPPLTLWAGFGTNARYYEQVVGGSTSQYSPRTLDNDIKF